MTTILAFVVKSIRLAVQQCVPGSSGIDEIIVAGGGSQNPVLMRSLLEAFHPTSVIVSDEVGIPAAAREAMAFAILGNDALFGLPTSLPSVTGAKEAVSLGSWAFPG